MLSLSSTPSSSPNILRFPSSRLLLSPKTRATLFRIFSSSSSTPDSTTSNQSLTGSGNYSGIQLHETVPTTSSPKTRIDTWISSRIHGVSRARVQSSIRAGLVSINNRIVDRVSHVIREGDKVKCTITELQQLSAEPEYIPLDIVYEDDHLLVVNKPPHMVVHPAPGNPNGTLVNGILHHCALPAIAIQNHGIPSESEEDSDVDASLGDYIDTSITASSVRPGIVHRLDKGTSGLLVVAKDEHSHSHLSEQFKQHSIHRVYVSITSGVPSTISGRVEVPIGRDVNNRIRMAAIPGSNGSRHTRNAASRYKLIELLAGGGAALVEWRLETGRTHQIRAHAKYLGIPLLGDEVYGGTKSMALSVLQPKVASRHHNILRQMVQKLERPCLHALALGFKHPHSGESMKFSCPPPADFADTLSVLRSLGSKKPLVEN